MRGIARGRACHHAVRDRRSEGAAQQPNVAGLARAHVRGVEQGMLVGRNRVGFLVCDAGSCVRKLFMAFQKHLNKILFLS